MPPSPAPDQDAPAAEAPLAGYSDAARTVLHETSARVQEMHGAIAAHTFDILQKIPLVSGPATLVRYAHDAIAGGVYAAIRRGGGGLLDLSAQLEKKRRQALSEQPPEIPDTPPSRLANGLRSALNAAFGDHLAETRSVLAIPMGLYLKGRAIPLTRAALASAFPSAGDRLCLFIHGLAYDERCWEGKASPAGKAAQRNVDIPRQLAAELGYETLTLRYNSGLPIIDNGAQLARLLETLLAAWPQPARELIIIGHSMGGLIARHACMEASEQALNWLRQTRMVICLGSPHLGSPVERLGHLANTALGVSKITAPLARIAAQRSQGIQNLRHGPAGELAPGIAWRFIGGSLAEDPESALARWIGDGLVTPDSATDRALEGDVLSRRIGGIGHMQLLHDKRVYQQIKDWLQQKPAHKRNLPPSAA